MFNIDHFINSNGQDFDYLVYLPDSNSNILIINLHGAGERGDIDKVKMMGINSYDLIIT